MQVTLNRPGPGSARSKVRGTRRRPVFAILTLALATLLTLPAAATAQYFGRNKVQYRSFDFDVVRTDHFDIYYYPQEREAALDAARVAERSYARLSQLLQHEFRDRKPVVLYASHTDFQQTNISGGFIDESTAAFAEALKNRMVLPFTGSYAEFDHVFTHELVHAFQYDVMYRRGVLNEANPFGVRVPHWFMEGMAEYLSVGRIDPLTISWLRDAVLNGYLRDIAEMSVRDDYLSYRFGQSLWQYVGNKWGDEVVGVLLQKTPRMGIERAFASTLGRTLGQLSEEWMAAVRKTYLPQLAEYTPADQMARRLTQHNRLEDPWFLSPAISPDGSRMVYLSQRSGFFFDLWLADARTGRPIRKLIGASRNADFESLRYMTSGASFSPDGRFLAFSAQSGGRDALYLYDLARNRVIRKLKLPLDAIESPSFSPDGQRIVFAGNQGGLSDLYITDLRGNLTRLTHDRYADLLPAWSPDGRHIAFSTDRGPGTDFERMRYGNLRVALFDMDTKQLAVLPAQERGKNVNPAWSPDSKSLIWVNDANGTSNLHLFDLEQQRFYRISQLLSGVVGVKETSPVLSWARNGRLLYTYFEKAGYNVYALENPLLLPRELVAAERPAVVAAAAPDARPSGTSRENGLPRLLLEGQGQAVEKANGGSAAPGPTVGVRSYYRAGSSFRPSDVPVVSREVQQPVSVMALLDSAAMALPDTAGFLHQDYKVKFTPDVIGRPTIGAQVGGHYGNGVYGGSYVALSDMLGNHNLMVAGNINGSLSDASFFGGYNFLKTRTNLSFTLEQLPLYRYYGSDYMTLSVDGQSESVAASVFVRDVIRSAAVYASYPFSKFRRLELGASGVYYESDVLYRGRYVRTGNPLNYSERIDDLSYVQPMAALVFDNSLFGWTGPVMGRRYRMQLSRTVGNFSFTEGLLDFRNYWNHRQRFVLATRLAGVARSGMDAARFGVYWGGPYYVRGYDANSFRLDSGECEASRANGGSGSLSPCPVRDQLIGSSAAILNTELRVPIIDELQIGLLGSFPPVDLVTFFDGGVAWDSRVCLRTNALNPRSCEDGQSQRVEVVWNRKAGQDPYLVREPVFSYGVGLRLNVFYSVLRLDYALPLSRPDRRGLGEGIFSISFGPSF